MQAALRHPNDTCTFSLIYANKTQEDILCREMLDDLVKKGKGRFKLTYTLDMPPAGWTHKKGRIVEWPVGLIGGCRMKQGHSWHGFRRESVQLA